MDSPLKKKSTTTFATPKSGSSALAMDITRDNRVAYNLDSEVYFAPRQGAAMKAWDAYHAIDESKQQMFSPHRIMLEDRSKRALLLSPAIKSHVSVFDVERGRNIAELQVKNMVADVDMNIRTMTPSKKFAQLHDSPSVVKEYGVGDNMVFTVQHDMRTRPVPLVIKEKDKHEVKLKGLNYTAVVATHEGDVAVGTSNGEIKLYANPDDGWKLPKNSFTQLQADGHAVTGLDVSYDGEWLLWTTAHKIALLHIKFVDPKSGLPTTAFKTRCPEELRNSAMILTLHKDDMAKHGLTSLAFTPAKFDASTSLVETMHDDPDSRAAKKDQANMLEQTIVTSTGSYIVSWNFRRLKLDYEKLNKNHESRIETTVQPQLTKLPSHIMATQFEYWDQPTADESVVVAATAEELSRLSLAK